jgi:hypothetical protein
MPALGETLTLPGWNGKPHLFVVVWGPGQIAQDATNDSVLLVCFDSIQPGVKYDPSCVLQAGDHPFISKPTFVSYRHLRSDEATHVDKMVASGVWAAGKPVSAAVLKKMQAGLCASKAVKPKYKAAMGCPPPPPRPSAGP